MITQTEPKLLTLAEADSGAIQASVDTSTPAVCGLIHKYAMALETKTLPQILTLRATSAKRTSECARAGKAHVSRVRNDCG